MSRGTGGGTLGSEGDPLRAIPVASREGATPQGGACTLVTLTQRRCCSSQGGRDWSTRSSGDSELSRCFTFLGVLVPLPHSDIDAIIYVVPCLVGRIVSFC
ncbi:hypothetical protein PVAP13_6KG079235 [Panicum virgatum]|uniref:Uncharacterized protein n=1 Tax=Panicum virgatum TaxID=38727 RepID=A0A8T0R9D5_PANVG|nr:hypothetical protein PVAP13_6KG079235 [Panicum virgatum]